jgi:hypothetical protein
MASDISSSRLKWAGNYLVNPWDEEGPVELGQYPRLKAYLERHREVLSRRHVAQKNGRSCLPTSFLPMPVDKRGARPYRARAQAVVLL